MLTVTDANAFAPGIKKYFAFSYDEMGLCAIRASDADEFPELAESTGLSPGERHEVVWRCLTRSQTIKEIAAATGLKEDEVETTLRFGKKSFVNTGERVTGTKGGRPAKTFGRLSRDEYPE